MSCRWKQVVISSFVAAVVALAVVLVTRPQPAPAIPPPSDDSAALSSLREELGRLREELSALRAAQAQAQPVPAVGSEPNAAAPLAQARKRTAPPMSTEQRFATLAGLISAQARNPSWAAQREAEIRALPSRHEYFERTTFEVVDCRTTACRVLATFSNDGEQGTFDTVFSGFARPFSYVMTRETVHAGRPAIEGFLFLEEPLP